MLHSAIALIPAVTSALPRGVPLPVPCRAHCGACCTAPSISSAIPGMPHGKPAGMRCVQLTAANACAIFGQPERPACCAGLSPSAEMCGTSRAAAMRWLTQLEDATAPSSTIIKLLGHTALE